MNEIGHYMEACSRLRTELTAAEAELTDLRKRLKFCPYCATGYEWQDDWPSVGPCAGCRRAEKAEAEVARWKERYWIADKAVLALAEGVNLLAEKLDDARAALAREEKPDAH